MKKNLLWAMMSLILLCACSDDDKLPVDADENFITSVTLTVDEVSYDAVIVENDITVTVPYNVSLDGAKASFVYTPSATIYPNPQEITNWNEERIFRVVSYNGDENQYKYLVVRNEISEDGDVVLKNTADIAAFSAKGTSVINGNLTIGTDDGEDITNLNGLENLKEVTGTITILDSYKGTDLTGLDNLKSIGGFDLGSSEKYSSVPLNYFSLNSIENIEGDVNIYDNSIVYVDFKDISVIRGSIKIASSILKSITAEKLTDVSGDFIVSCKNDKATGGEIKEFTLPEITNIGGTLSAEDFAELETIYFPKLQTAGSIVFENLPFDLHRIDFPEIVEINGDLTLHSYTSYQVIGSVTTGNTNLQSFEGFEKLKTISGTMSLKAFTEVTNIPNVSNATVGGIVLERMEKIRSLDLSNTSFANQDPTKECVLKYSWMAIDKIIGNSTFPCNLIVDNADIVNGFPILENIETIGGIYMTQPYMRTEQIVVSSQIKKITGNLHIDVCTDYNDVIIDIPDLKEIDGYVFLSSAQCAQFDIQLPALTTVGGQFYAVGGGVQSINLSSLQQVSVGTVSTNLDMEVLFGFDEGFKEGMGMNFHFCKGDDIVFESLEEIGGNGFKLNLCYDFTPIKRFSCPKLKSIAKEFVMISTPYEDDGLTQLEFPSLMSLPKVTINDFMLLTDFSTFGTLFTNGQISSASDWSVTGCGYNPTYEDMKEGKYTPTTTSAQTKSRTLSSSSSRSRVK